MKVSLANVSLIAQLHITSWSANGRDKQASAEVVRDKSAQRQDVARVHKSLLPTSRTLKDIASLVGEARKIHFLLTAPWSDNGDRILPVTLMQRYVEQMDTIKLKYMRQVNVFLGEYEKDKNGAAFVLGDLYNAADYPPESVIRERFSFRYHLVPLPTSDDFRVTLPEEMGEVIKQAYEQESDARVNAAMRDIWDRVHDTLGHLRDRLTDDGSKPNIFRNSMLENAQELTALLKHLNVTQDPQLEHARAVLERQLIGIDSEDLRTDGGLRARIVDEVQSLLGSFNAFSMMSDVA